MRKLLFLCVSLAASVLAAEVVLTESVLDSGATVRLAQPEDWNGSVALLAHGYMPEDYPLYAYFGLEDEPHKTLLAKGWAVASSSFRRNGIIIGDAMTDMKELLDWVVSETGELDKTILVGGSMGGAITARLLEAHPGVFAGAMIMSNGIYSQEEGKPLDAIQHEPGVPVLLLTNIDEVDVPQAYATVVEAQGGVAPLLLVVGREGHMAYNEVEYVTAVENLLTWIDTSERPSLDSDVTADPEEPASTAQFSGSSAASEIVRIDPVYGNFVSALTPSDMAKLGIAVGDSFTVDIADRSFPVKFGTTYSDVPVGDWVAFVNQNKRLLFCINFGQAARVLGLEIGDELTVTK